MTNLNSRLRKEQLNLRAKGVDRLYPADIVEVVRHWMMDTVPIESKGDEAYLLLVEGLE